MGISHYKAVFRRAAASDVQRGYTKDFLQSPTRMSDVFRQMFGGRNPDYEPLTYRWPGGQFAGGRIYAAADYNHAANRGRLEVGQWTADGAPEPWRVGDPTTNALITLPGDPLAAIPDAADAQWDDIEPLQPWLMMVQVDNSQTDLHLRAYLGAPKPDLLEADLARAPDPIRIHMNGQGGLASEALPSLWFDTDDLRDPWRESSDARGREAFDVAQRGEAVASSEPGVDYRTANEEVSSAAPEPFSIDPNERDRATRAHAITQNAVAAAIQARHRTPLSPRGEPSYDIAWEEEDGTLVVAEIKSINGRNEERQLRLGLGQLLRYRSLLRTKTREVHALLVTSSRVSDERWSTLCAEFGVGLLSAEGFAEQLDHWLSAQA